MFITYKTHRVYGINIKSKFSSKQRSPKFLSIYCTPKLFSPKLFSGSVQSEFLAFSVNHGVEYHLILW